MAPSAPWLRKVLQHDALLCRSDYLLSTRAGAADQVLLYSGISLASKVVMHHCVYGVSFQNFTLSLMA